MSSNPSPDYAALPARELSDRELDALVAERVFGFTINSGATYLRYSTTLDATMRVARAMASKGFSYHLRLIPDTDKHEAGFIFGEHSWLIRTADSPARALCLAALAPASPAAGKERAK